MADPLRGTSREHPCIWSAIVFCLFQVTLFNLPPLTNKSDTEFSTAEKVETMYTEEVPCPVERKDKNNRAPISKQVNKGKEVK